MKKPTMTLDLIWKKKILQMKRLRQKRTKQPMRMLCLRFRHLFVSAKYAAKQEAGGRYLEFPELNISDPDGNPICCRKILQKHSVTLFFCKQKWRTATEKTIFESTVSQTSRFQVAHAIHGLLNDGFSVHLSHEGNTLDLRKKRERFEKVHHEQWDGLLNFPVLMRACLAVNHRFHFVKE